MVVFTKRVDTSSDDAEQETDGTMSLSSSDLELHVVTGDDEVGMRWTGVTIPQGATINSAKIQFHVDEVNDNSALTVNFSGELATNAGTFTSTDNDITDRTDTSADVDWAIPAWENTSDEGSAQLSADLSSIIQEIVNQGGWVSGNSLVIMINTKNAPVGTGERTAESFDGEAGSAPELSIDFTVTPSIDKTFQVDALIKALGDNGNCGATIQSGTFSFGTGDSSTDETINAVVLDDSFLVFQYDVDSSDPSRFQIRGDFTTTTNIHFERDNTEGVGVVITGTWYVVEFAERISSQRGRVSMSTTTVNQTISSVDLTKSFNLLNFLTEGVTWGNGDGIRGQLTSSTNLELETTSTIVNPDAVSWQVVEYAGAKVQRGLVTFTSGVDTSTDIAITGVDLSRSIVLITNTQQSVANPDTAGLTAELTTSTNLHIERESSTGITLNIAWEVIEFPSNVKVQSGTETFGTSQTVANVAITTVDLTHTIAVLSHNQKGGRSNDTIDDNPETVWYRSELTTSTNLQLTRADSDTSDGNVSWFIVEFGPKQQRCFDIDARLAQREEFTVDAIIFIAQIDKDFIIDAILQATFDETFTIDALLQDTFDETFEIDALVQETFTETFTIDSILKATFDETFTIDALLQATFTETFEVDSILKATFTETFEIDAFIKALDTDFTLLVDGLIQAENQKMFLIDGLTQATFDEDFTIDSILIVRRTETFDVDSILIVRRTETFEVDALIQTQNIDETFEIDGLIQRQNIDETFEIDALVQATFTETFEIDALLQATFDEDFIVDGLTQATFTETFTIDALLQETFIETFEVDALTQATFTETFLVDSILRATFTETFEVDALIQRQDIDETFIIDSVLVNQRQETFEVDAFLRGEQTHTFLIDGVTQADQTEIFIIDSILFGGGLLETFTIDALLQATFTETFQVDAQLALLNQEEEFDINALLQATFTETFEIDALLQTIFTEDFQVDSILRATFTETFEVDAQLLELQQVTINVDGLLLKTQTEIFFVDSRLLQVNTETFTVNGRLAVRHIFRIDSVLVRQVTTDVDSILKATINEDFLIDSVLKQGNQEFFIVDALLVTINTETFEVDAVLAEQKTKTFEIDSLLQSLNQEETFEVDAVLAEVKTTTFITDAILIFEAKEKDFLVDSIIFRSGDILCSDSAVAFSEDWSVASSDPVNLQGWILTNSAPPTSVLFNTPSFPNVLRMECLGSPQEHFATKLFDNKILPFADFTWQFKHNHIDGCTGFQTRMSTNLQEDAVLNKFANQTTIKYRTFNGNFGEDVFLEIYDKNGVLKVTSSMIDIFNDTVVFPSIERVAGIITLNVYTDAGRTTHIAGSPVSVDTNGFEMNSLNAIYFGNIGTSGGNRQAREEFDDILIQADVCPKALVDARLQATFTETFTVDATNLMKVNKKEFLVDGIIQIPSATQDFFVDAILTILSQTETFFVDAFIRLQSLETFFVDAQLFAVLTFDEEFEVDAFVKAFAQEKDFLVDSVLIVVPSVVTEVDGLLSVVNIEEFQIDAKVAFVNTETFEIDAQLKAIVTVDEEFEVDGLIKAFAQEETFIVDGLMNIAPKETFTVHAILKALDQEREFEIDAHVRLLGEEEFEIDAQLIANVPETTTFFVDAIVGFFRKFDVDALLQATFTETFQVDTVILTPVKVTVDAFIKRLGDNCSSGLIFNDPIDSNSGWVVINGLGVQIRVDGANFPKKIEYDRLGNFGPGFLYKLLDVSTPTINSLGSVRLDFKYNHTFTELGGNDGGMLMGLTDVGGKIIESSRFGARHVRVGGQFQLKAQMSDGLTTVETAVVNIPTNLDTFITVEKIGSSIRINAYSDQARTIHIGGSPTPFVSVAGLNQIIFDRIGGSGGNPTVLPIFIETGVLDDIQVYGNVCSNFVVDGLIELPQTQKEFQVDAILVNRSEFTCNALIKAIGDIRCLPSFAEKIFDDDLADTSNWSSEIVNTAVDGWSDQQIFIDGESIPSEDIIRMTMEPGGFNPTPIFKSRYRRKLIGSEGGVGVVSGDNFRMEFELHQISKGEGSWIGLNRTGFHPQNDPNTSTFQLNSGDGEVTATLSDGVSSVTTPPLIWSPAGEESPDSLFMVIESVGGQLILNAYDDAGHTLHNGNSPVSVSTSIVNKDDLRMFWLFVGANNKLADASDPIADAEIDNILIYADPCPIIRVDALLLEFFSEEFTINAQLVRKIDFTIDAKLRGRKDFFVDAVLVGQTKFDINAILTAPVILEFRINALIISQEGDIAFRINAIIIRGITFSIGAIFSTDSSEPNFSLTHMQSIIHMFSGIVDTEFTIDAQLRGRVSFTIDAKLVTPVTFSINAVLSTEPQPLLFSLTHLQDIVPLVSISEEVTTEVNAIVKKFDQEREFRISARLTLRFDETFEADAQLSQITKTVKPFIDSLLKGILEEKSLINSILVNRFVEEPSVNSRVLGIFDEEFIVGTLLKGIGLDQDLLINARIIKKKEFTVEVDAIIKLVGEDGFCNFFPATNTIGTGLEQFVGPNTPSHESDVDLFIGQQFNLNNQQVRKATILLRATGLPNEITSDSFILGKIWSNVVKGDLAGEVVEATSINTINASTSSGDLPAGVWTEVTFDFGLSSPFLTGDFLIGFQHIVGTGINDPQGVGVARPVISGGNVISGESLFRRESNSAFIDPTKWRFVIGDLIDMIINIELINGDEIILGKGKQCPNVDSILIVRNIEEYSVGALIVNRFKETSKVNVILVNRNIEDTLVDAVLSPLKEFTIDAQLVVLFTSNSETFFVDARLQALFIETLEVDAVLITGFQKPFITDALFKKFDQTFITFVDARIKAFDQEETFEVNAIILLTTQPEIFVDAILKGTFDEEFEVNAILKIPQPPIELTFFVDAQLKLENFRIRVDVLLQEEKQLETRLNAILTDKMEQDFSVNSIVKALGSDEEFIVNSVLTKGFQKPFVVNAQLLIINSEDTFVNAILSKDSIINEFSVSSILTKIVGFETSAFIQALGINGNNGGTNPLAQNPFVGLLSEVGAPPQSTTSVPIGTNLCGQRLTLPAVPVIITSISFNLHRDGLSGSPVGTLRGIIYRNSIEGNTIIAGDILDISDNIINLGDLTTSITGDQVTFTFSTVEIFQGDNVFLGLEITGTNEEVLFGTSPVQPIDGGDFTTTSTSTWGPDLGFDATILVLIDDEPRQRASSVVSAILGVRTHEFTVGGVLKGNNIDQEFRIGVKLVILTSEEFTIGAILIGSIDVVIGAFVGEVQETVLDVESVVVTNNSDSGTESTIGVGGV